MIFKIVIIGIVGVIVSIIIKQVKPEFSLLINISLGVIIFFMVIDKLAELLNGILKISLSSNISTDIITTLFKVLGVGYLIEFSADIADDSGNSSLSNKIVFAGKIIVCCISLPILIELFNSVVAFL